MTYAQKIIAHEIKNIYGDEKPIDYIANTPPSIRNRILASQKILGVDIALLDEAINMGLHPNRIKDFINHIKGDLKNLEHHLEDSAESFDN